MSSCDVTCVTSYASWGDVSPWTFLRTRHSEVCGRSCADLDSWGQGHACGACACGRRGRTSSGSWCYTWRTSSAPAAATETTPTERHCRRRRSTTWTTTRLDAPTKLSAVTCPPWDSTSCVHRALNLAATAVGHAGTDRRRCREMIGWKGLRHFRSCCYYYLRRTYGRRPIRRRPSGRMFPGLGCWTRQTLCRVPTDCAVAAPGTKATRK